MRLEYFQMLDRVDAIDFEHKQIRAVSTVPEASTVFEGHFPGHPIMPGVLLLETMAQASGYLLLAMDDFSRMPYFAGCKQAYFRSFVEPNDTMQIEASCIHLGSGYGVIKAAIRKDGNIVCDASDMVYHLDAANPADQNRVAAMAHVFEASGSAPNVALQQAYAALNGGAMKQALVLSYMDVFLYIGLMFLICVPFVLLVRAKKNSKVDLSEAMH